MQPGRYNINVVNGTTFTLAPIWQIGNLPVNLTGYSADMQVRDISNNLIVDFSSNVMVFDRPIVKIFTKMLEK